MLNKYGIQYIKSSIAKRILQPEKYSQKVLAEVNIHLKHRATLFPGVTK